MLRIGIVDSDDSTREKLRDVIKGESFVEVIGESSSYDRFVQLVIMHTPHVAIVCLDDTVNTYCINCVGRLAALPEPPIIIVLGSREQDLLLAISMGAREVFNRSSQWHRNLIALLKRTSVSLSAMPSTEGQKCTSDAETSLLSSPASSISDSDGEWKKAPDGYEEFLDSLIRDELRRKISPPQESGASATEPELYPRTNRCELRALLRDPAQCIDEKMLAEQPDILTVRGAELRQQVHARKQTDVKWKILDKVIDSIRPILDTFNHSNFRELLANLLCDRIPRVIARILCVDLPHLKGEPRERLKDEILGEITEITADPVECSVYARTHVGTGQTFDVLVSMRLPRQSIHPYTMSLLTEDGRASLLAIDSLEIGVRRGSKVTVHLDMPGLHVNNPLVEDLTWTGDPGVVDFQVTVPSHHEPGPTPGTVTVSQEQVPLGHIRFKVIVMSPEQRFDGSFERSREIESRRYRNAFISYASDDRDEVIKRVQMLRFFGISYFLDKSSLVPGSFWEQELFCRIDACDLFLLFWSAAAKKSDWVLQEALYALKRQKKDRSGLPEIKPVILERPPPPPPLELAHMHFDDPILYYVLDRPVAGFP